MSKVRDFAEIALNIPFTKFDLYDLYWSDVREESSGWVKRLHPLCEISDSFGLTKKSLRTRLRRRESAYINAMLAATSWNHQENDEGSRQKEHWNVICLAANTLRRTLIKLLAAKKSSC